MDKTELVVRLSEPRLFGIAFCVGMAALLAILVLAGCDKNGRFKKAR